MKSYCEHKALAYEPAAAGKIAPAGFRLEAEVPFPCSVTRNAPYDKITKNVSAVKFILVSQAVAIALEDVPSAVLGRSPGKGLEDEVPKKPKQFADNVYRISLQKRSTQLNS